MSQRVCMCVPFFYLVLCSNIEFINNFINLNRSIILLKTVMHILGWVILPCVQLRLKSVMHHFRGNKEFARLRIG